MTINRARRNTISDAFERSVRRYNHDTALIFKEREWSYAELGTAVNNVAIKLQGLGFAQGARIAAYGHNSDAYLILFLACAKAGLTHVPINFGLTGESLNYIIENAQASAIFVDMDLHQNIAEAVPQEQMIYTGSLHGGEDLDVLQWAKTSSGDLYSDINMHNQDMVQLMYTSGTTSNPKGAIMSHECLLQEYQSCIIALDIKQHDICLAALPLYHTAQMHAFMLPSLLMGAKTILMEAVSPKLCFNLIEQHNITSFFAPPTVWIGFLRHAEFSGERLASLEKLYYGASIMPETIVHELIKELPNAGLYNCYGQTETSPLITVLRPEEHKDRPASAGRTVLNVESRIVDEDMQDVPSGEKGELVHRTPHLMSGYWNNEQATRDSIVDGWFKTGDLAIQDEQGYISIVDRVKDVINTGGVLVASRDVEEALYQNSTVAEVAVVGLPDDKWIEAISAFVVIKQGQTCSESDIEKTAAEQLARFKQPKRIYFVTELPKNASGKVLKRELREQFS